MLLFFSCCSLLLFTLPLFSHCSFRIIVLFMMFFSRYCSSYVVALLGLLLFSHCCSINIVFSHFVILFAF
jgi:hypothetical protein